MLIDPHLPRGRAGRLRIGDRRVISGILHVLKTGRCWCDVPVECGPATTVYNRCNRWSQRSLWQRMFERVAATGGLPIELILVAIRRSFRLPTTRRSCDLHPEFDVGEARQPAPKDDDAGRRIA